MTANHEHTPTTGQVETGFALYLYDRENIVISSGRDRFKAWLAERDARIEAAAEQRGAARGWDEGCKAGLDTGLTIGEVVMGLKPRPVPAPPENPYRADQGGDDD